MRQLKLNKAFTLLEAGPAIRNERRTVHAVGDGTFIVDGRKLDRKKMMSAKLQSGV